MLKLSTARNIMVLLVDSTDHVTGKTGLTLTITASKNGAAFASITPTVTERGTGWYSLALTAAHTDTLGDLAIRCTGTAADPADVREQVFTLLPGELVTLAAVTHTGAVIPTVSAVTGLTAANLDATVSSRLATAGYTAPDNAGVTAIKAKTDSLAFTVAGQVDANVQYVNDVLVTGNGQLGTEWNP